MSLAMLRTSIAEINSTLDAYEEDPFRDAEIDEGRRLAQEAYLLTHSDCEWGQWLIGTFPEYFTSPDGSISFGDFHRVFWEWIFAIPKTSRPTPLVDIIFRFAGKSTGAETACCYLGAEGIRKYGLYISNTQTQADDHVGSISEMLQLDSFTEKHPLMGQPLVDKFNRSLGWKISRLRTAGGFTVDAVGLDRAMRGAKLGKQRPDFMIFDDIDDEHDSARTVEKKIDTITRKILPAGASNLAVMMTQNLVHPGSIFKKLSDGEADFLYNRDLHGPTPAIREMTWDEAPDGYVSLTGGESSWPGRDLAYWQSIIDDIGWRAFLIECQHEIQLATGMLLANIWHDSIHVIPQFQIPSRWRIDRSYDYGFGHPWACIWWAEANGEDPIELDGKTRIFPAGTLFAIGEHYGWSGKPNVGSRDESEKQARIVRDYQREAEWGERTVKGPADNQIFPPGDGVESIALRMERAAGITWSEADQSAGSRVAGADAVISRLRAALVTPMERPGLFICKNCPQIIRTFPVLPVDPIMDGAVDKKSEDHLWDPTRYRCLDKHLQSQRVKVTGV